MNMTTGLSLGQVFGRMMELFRSGYKHVFVSIVLPLGLITGVLSGAIAAFQTPGTSANPFVFLPIFIGLALIAVIAVIVSVVGVGALGHASITFTAGRPIVTSESWRQGLRIKVWGTTLLTGIVVTFGFMCCLLPGIYLALIWSLLLPVMFEEATFFPGALGRSYSLTQFNPQGGLGNDPRFRMFLIYAAVFGTMYLLVSVVQLPMYIIMFVTMARDVSSGGKPGEIPGFLNWIQVPTSIVTSIIQHSMTFMANIGAGVVYFDIRGRQEASDLTSAIESIGAPPEVSGA